MHQKLIILVLMSFGFTAEAQFQNAIFNGGLGHGFNVRYYNSLSNNSIFSGANDDGFVYAKNLGMLNSSIFKGSIDDGFNVLPFKQKIHSTIFEGSIDDGWSAQNFSEDQNSVIWTGGPDDGWTSASLMTKTSNIVFNGGSDDGFSNSGISKMKWNGNISDEWLMAANWTPNIVPGKNEAACIPEVNTHYPVLKAGVLGLSLNKTYACKALYIEPLALVTLEKNVGFVSNGYLEVEGTLNFLGIGLTSFELLDGATLEIRLGGMLNIVKF